LVCHKIFLLVADDDPSGTKFGSRPYSVVKLRRRVFIEKHDESFVLILSKDLGDDPDTLPAPIHRSR